MGTRNLIPLTKRRRKISKLLLSLTLVLFVVFIAGCAEERLTREEYLELRHKYDEMRTRFYDDTSQEEVLTAVDELLRLADDDYEISHGDNGCIGERDWFLYLVLAASSGKDYWYVDTNERDGGTEVIIRVISEEVGYSGAYMPNAGVVTMTTPSMNNPDVIDRVELTYREAVYHLFYARLDYLLGKRDTWVTCSDASRERRELGLQGSLGELCMCANDRRPQGASSCVSVDENDQNAPNYQNTH